MRSSASARAIVETLVFEAVCLGMCAALWIYGLPLVDHAGWMVAFIMAVGSVPAPVFIGLRYPALSRGGGAMRHTAVAAAAGLAVSAGLVALALCLDYMDACPPAAVECSRYLFTALVTGYSVLVVMPMFLLLAPVVGSVRRARVPR